MRLIRHGLASLLAAFVAAPAASAATPVEGYRAPDNRVGCVMYQGYNDNGNAVKCGRRGSSNGLLLPSAGAARKQKWRWPARQLGDLFFTATYGQTLYLYGGTAKLEGDDSILRCEFRRGAASGATTATATPSRSPGAETGGSARELEVRRQWLIATAAWVCAFAVFVSGSHRPRPRTRSAGGAAARPGDHGSSRPAELRSLSPLARVVDAGRCGSRPTT